MRQSDLFASDSAIRLRDNKGRFATKERAYADRILAENQVLRCEVSKYKYLYEKYFRAWMSCAGKWSALQRKLTTIKEMCHGK